MKLRASNARQAELCPGSMRMQEGLPDIKTVESLQGDRLHDYSAHPEYERRLLAREEQSLLRLADYLERLVFNTVGFRGSAFIDYREQTLENDLLSGHPDLLRFYPEEKASVVTDRKFGWDPVARADVNLQMRVYAVLAPTPDVFVSILQPRSAYAERITIAKYNSDTKAAAATQLAAIVKACEDPAAPLIPGEEQCRYCRARAICPALKEAVTKELVVFDDDLSAGDFSKPKKLSIVERRLAQAKDQQLGALFNACALARLVNDPLNDEIRRRIAAGQMTDFTLSKESEIRKITNVPKAISLIVLRGLLTRAQVLGTFKMDVGTIEDLLAETKDLKPKEAKAEINTTLESVIEKEPRKARILRK